MKRKKVFFSLLSFFSLSLLALGVTTSALKQHKTITPVHAEQVVNADYSRFKIRNQQAGSSLVRGATYLQYQGAWDSSFAVTDQFNSTSTSYSLKASVKNDTWTNSGDDWLGFNIYYDNTTYIGFYLKWNADCATSIAEGVMLNRVNGANNQVYDSAIGAGAWTTRGDFTDLWSDGGGWSRTLNGANVNLRTSSRILLNEGFDMTLHVERKVHLGRLADYMYIQIDAFESDGTTPATFYSPSLAVDAVTNPKGGAESPWIAVKPQIGFFDHKVGVVTIENIVFKDKVATQKAVTVERAHLQPETFTVDKVNNILTLKGASHFNQAVFLNGLPTTDKYFELSAYAGGSEGNTDGLEIGFLYYLDSSNYLFIYFCWNGVLNLPSDMKIVAVVNGANKDTAHFARNPWDNFAPHTLPIQAWSDFSGWVTNASFPCGADGNFNNFRSEGQDLVVSSTINVGLTRARSIYKGRVVDQFRLSIMGTGTDNFIHRWYTPTIAFDGFTYPMGGEASPVLNTAPRLGLYNFNSTTDIEYSDFRYNGSPLTLDFSTRQLTRAFEDEFMHLDKNVDGQCDTYYPLAKAAWNDLSSEIRALYVSDAEFEDGYARLLAWATAKGDKLDTNNLLVANMSPGGLNTRTNDLIKPSILLTAFGLLSCLALVAFKKKRA